MKNGGRSPFTSIHANMGKLGAENGGQRNVPGQQQDHGEDGDGRQRRGGRGNKKDSEAGGDPLAALEFEARPETCGPSTAASAATA